MVIQTQLRSGDTHLTTWLPIDKKFRVGSFVTLKDSDEPNRFWEVVAITGNPIDKNAIYRGWNNNI